MCRVSTGDSGGEVLVHKLLEHITCDRVTYIRWCSSRQSADMSVASNRELRQTNIGGSTLYALAHVGIFKTKYFLKHEHFWGISNFFETRGT